MKMDSQPGPVYLKLADAVESSENDINLFYEEKKKALKNFKAQLTLLLADFKTKVAIRKIAIVGSY